MTWALVYCLMMGSQPGTCEKLRWVRELKSSEMQCLLHMRERQEILPATTPIFCASLTLRAA